MLNQLAPKNTWHSNLVHLAVIGPSPNGLDKEPQISLVFATTGSEVMQWTSPRDLAIQPLPTTVALADSNSMEFFSVIPSFGEDGNLGH